MTEAQKALENIKTVLSRPETSFRGLAEASQIMSDIRKLEAAVEPQAGKESTEPAE